MKQLLCHVVGDYILQSHWMAQNKTKSNRAAALHAVAYGLPFLSFRPKLMRFSIIVGSHFLIDRFRLARYIVWAKDWLAPKGQTHKLTATGMQEDVPVWLSTWLLIIVDNTLHCCINAWALRKK